LLWADRWLRLFSCRGPEGRRSGRAPRRRRSTGARGARTNRAPVRSDQRRGAFACSRHRRRVSILRDGGLCRASIGHERVQARRARPLRARSEAQCRGSRLCGQRQDMALVSRIVRLLLHGVAPGEILAITFTRHAARRWRPGCASGWNCSLARTNRRAAFLRERAIPDNDIDAALARGDCCMRRSCARSRRSRFRHSTAGICNSYAAPVERWGNRNLTLTEQTSALLEEAWELFAAASSAICTARPLRSGCIVRDHGLQNTAAASEISATPRRLVGTRRRWAEAVERALAAQAAALGVAVDGDLIGQLFSDAGFADELREFNTVWQRTPRRTKPVLKPLRLPCRTATTCSPSRSFVQSSLQQGRLAQGQIE